MFYYLYEIKNTLNGKIYIGVHKTKSLEDGYMGSGKFIISAIKKYGKENFVKTIIEYFETIDQMYFRESEIVNESFVQRRDTYNIAVGGSGASILKNRKSFTKKHSNESKEKIRVACSKYRHTDKTKQLLKENHFSKRNPELAIEIARKNFKDKPKSDEHKKKLSSANKGINKKIVKCLYCEKTGGISIMCRWHFDNCKNRKNMLGVA